jgi:hypothetical protein
VPSNKAACTPTIAAMKGQYTTEMHTIAANTIKAQRG